MASLQINDSLLQRLRSLAEANNLTIDDLLQQSMAEFEAKTTPDTDDDAFLTALNLAADAVLTYDSSYTITYFNQGAQIIFGHQAEDVIGQPLDLLFSDSSGNVAKAHSQIHDADEWQVAQFKHKDGTLFTLDIFIFKNQHHFTAMMRKKSSGLQMSKVQREQQDMLALLTENATDLICLNDPDGTFIYVSPACITITGYTPDELIGTNPYEYFHPDDLENIINSHQSSLHGQNVRNLIHRSRRKNGSYVWLETATRPVFDDDDKIINLVTISRDISERHRIEEELKSERDLLHSIMETSPSGITVVDRDGQIIFVNKRAEEIYGAPRGDVTSRSFDSATWKHTDYDGDPWPDEKQPFVRVMQTKKPVWEVRHAIEWSNGEVVYLSINGAPILDEDGEVNKVVFTVEDYTERKHQQDKLEAALARERQLNKLRATFISMVSHEFRTPMTVIMTSTGLLRMKSNRLTPDELLSRLQRIESQVKHLNRLITDVTFVNKNDMVGLPVEPVDMEIHNFFLEIAAEAEMSYPQHRSIILSSDGSCSTARLDPALFQQIFINLFSNALKYSPAESAVTCTYNCRDGWLVVEVADEGIGIPQVEQPQLFSTFYRATNVGTVSGTGLGLAIVKRAVDALGGNIDFSSEEGLGTRFVVTLPLMVKANRSFIVQQ